MVVVLFVHPAISGQAFFFFRCHEIKDVEQTLAGDISPNAATNTSYLVADYSLKCFDGPWKAMLPWAIIVVVGFSFGVPLFLLWTLCKHRKAIQEIGRQAILDDAAKKEVARVEKTSIRRRAATRVNVGLTTLAKKASAVRTRIRALSRSRTSSVTVTVDGGNSSAGGDVSDRREGGGANDEELTEGKGTDGDYESWEGGNPMHTRRSSLEQMAPDLDSQMTGGGDRRHWQRADGCADRDTDGNTVNESTESKSNRHSRLVSMDTNPMNTSATLTSDTETEAKENTVERGEEQEEENRAAIRLSVLYSIYKPACFYFDVINIFHVRAFASH